MSTLFTAQKIYTLSLILRLVLLLYGLLQDAFSPLKYTDIDYYVFTSAAKYVSLGRSPYMRATYRYTPLLAWLLYPTTLPLCFNFGKVLFAICDVVAGWLVVKVLRGGYGNVEADTCVNEQESKTKTKRMDERTALMWASTWLLNPMVATISTRGSSEGVLAVLVMSLLWAVLSKRVVVAGFLLGLSVHFKIYPFIYGMSIMWWLDETRIPTSTTNANWIVRFFNRARLTFLATSLITFVSLNALMYGIYGISFLEHTFLHHLIRLDHRHNFSPYNTLLYISSSAASMPAASLAMDSSSFSIWTARQPFLHAESLAFVPQLLLSALAVPIALAKRDLPCAMLVQTWLFVTFNKVCTSQYFLWYLILVPFWLSRSPRLSSTKASATLVLAGISWLVTQAAWLRAAYGLEFLGQSTWMPGLWVCGLLFFAANLWVLGIVISDVRAAADSSTPKTKRA